MRRRHPFGGNISNARFGTLVLGACLAVPLMLVGCGGSNDHHQPPAPRYHSMTIILNVSDLNGDALGEATVWVGGVAQTGKTSWTHVTLGDGYPESWAGFQANWIRGEFTVATYGPGDSADVEVIVSKPGFFTQATTFTVTDNLPIDVFARDTFLMEPSGNPNTADIKNPRMHQEPGEVIGWDKKATSSELGLGSMFKVAAATGPTGSQTSG